MIPSKLLDHADASRQRVLLQHRLARIVGRPEQQIAHRIMALSPLSARVAAARSLCTYQVEGVFRFADGSTLIQTNEGHLSCAL